MDEDGRNRQNRDSRNALDYAILSGQQEAAMFLVQEGINFNHEDCEHKSPLWHAASKGMKGVIVDILVKHEIDLVSLNRSCLESVPGSKAGRTAIEEAERAGHKDIVKMLEDRYRIQIEQNREPNREATGSSLVHDDNSDDTDEFTDYSDDDQQYRHLLLMMMMIMTILIEQSMTGNTIYLGHH